MLYLSESGCQNTSSISTIDAQLEFGVHMIQDILPDRNVWSLKEDDILAQQRPGSSEVLGLQGVQPNLGEEEGEFFSGGQKDGIPEDGIISMSRGSEFYRQKF